MSCHDIRIAGNAVRVLVIPDGEVGSLPPDGYLEWHAWAETQRKAGLRQKKCGRCAKWKFPQELSGEEIVAPAKDRLGNAVEIRKPVCRSCAR